MRHRACITSGMGSGAPPPLHNDEAARAVRAGIGPPWTVGLLALLLGAGAAGCGSQTPARNLVLISLDTTRADYLDTGDGSRAFTPHLRRFADQSWVFSRAFTAANQTLPAHLAMLTGHNPYELGVFGNDAVYDGRRPMIQEALKGAGWRTAAVISLGALAASTGMGRGFDRYVDSLNPPSRFYVSAADVTNQAIDLLDRAGNERAFLFAHYSDPHSPYAPPGVEAPFTVLVDGAVVSTFNAYSGAILRLSVPLTSGSHTVAFRAEVPGDTFASFTIRRLKAPPGARLTTRGLGPADAFGKDSYTMTGPASEATVTVPVAGDLRLFQVIPNPTLPAAVRLYRQEVESLDRELGRLLQWLREGPRAADTAVVLVADHGECLGEREGYVGHVRYLNRNVVHVPLIVHVPGWRPARIETPVSSADIGATLAALSGIDAPGFPAARSLVSPRRGQREEARPVLSFAFAPGAVADLASVIVWPYQAVFGADPEAPPPEYYDLRLPSDRKLDYVDPGLLGRRDGNLFHKLEDSRRLRMPLLQRRGPQPGAVPESMREQLRALGYL